MTVLEATTRLIEHFARNDVFSLEADFKNIVLISDTDGDKTCILAALDELERRKLIIKKDFNGTTYWNLLYPILSFNSEVTMPLALTTAITEFLNNYKGKSVTDPLNINAQDIFDLLVVARLAK